jgi:hypothetical protein
MSIKVKRTALVAAVGALAMAVPAGAHPGPGSHPGGSANNPGHTTPPAKSHRCAPHNVAYVVSGTITASTMAQNSDGTWSGTLTYTVTHHNHWAANDPGTATLTNVKVAFDNGATAFATGELVKLIGKLGVVRGGHGKHACTNSGPQGSPTFRMVVVSPAAS